MQSNSCDFALPETLPPGLKTLEAGENAAVQSARIVTTELQVTDVVKMNYCSPETLPPTITTLDVSRNALVIYRRKLTPGGITNNAGPLAIARSVSRSRYPVFRGEGPQPTRIIVEHNPFFRTNNTEYAAANVLCGLSKGPGYFFAMGDFSIVRVTHFLHQAVQGIWLTNLEGERQWRAFGAEGKRGDFQHVSGSS